MSNIMLEKQSERILSALSALHVPNERKKLLEPLINYIVKKKQSDQLSHLIFVCTHNSRRSQMGQFWGHYLANYFDLPIVSYSAGTEKTSCAPQTIDAIERLGFDVYKDPSNTENTNYSFKSMQFDSELILFSKELGDVTAQHAQFATLMCCSQAEETCPFVPGSELRISLNYNDPKRSDGSPEEALTYDQTLLLIGSEIFHVFFGSKKTLAIN